MASCDDMIYKRNDLPYEYYQVFRDMREKKEFCDVTLNLGNVCIYAHKIVLAACIPYFRSLFGGNATEDRQNEVTLTDVNPAALETLIDFAYTCELKITSENVQMLLSTACFLEVDHVKKACGEFLINGISPLHALSVRNLGIKLSCENLVNKLDKYIKENFDEVSVSEEFTNLPYWYLKDLVSSDDLQVSSEEKVFEAVIRWVKAQPDADERRLKLPELLSCVRMPFLKLYYLKDVIATNELVKGSLQCRDILDDARDYHLFPEKRHDVETSWRFTYTPRQFRNSSNAEDKNLCFVMGDKPLSSKSDKKSADQKNNPNSYFSCNSFPHMVSQSPSGLKRETFCPELKLGEYNFAPSINNFAHAFTWDAVVPTRRRIVTASRAYGGQPKLVSE